MMGNLVRTVRVALFCLAVATAGFLPHVVVAEGDSRMRFSIWGAWEAADLGQVESDVARIANEEKTDFVYYFGGTASSSAVDSEGGLGGGLEITHMSSDTVGLGFRLGYFSPSDVEGEAHGRGDFNEEFTERWEVGTSIVPVMVGISLEGGDPQGVRFRGAFFAGLVFASANLDQSFSMDLPLIAYHESYSSSAPLSGSGGGADISGRVSMKVSPSTDLFAELGYLVASIKQMKFDKDVDVDGDGRFDYEKGKALERSGSSDPLEFDFGGIRIRGGVQFSFGKSSEVRSN